MAQVYTIDKYRDILSTGFPYEFPEETLSLINFLAKEVGTHIPVTNPTFDGKGGKKKVNAGKSWDKAAPFKATVFEKHEGLRSKIDDIRGALNKITDKNYDQQKSVILESMKDVSAEDVEKLCSCIFEIATGNKFYSEQYAQLYKELSDEMDGLMTILEKTYSKFVGCFSEIKYVDSTVDYDGFCEYQKSSEKRVSLATFICNLVKKDAIDVSYVEKLADKLITMALEYVVVTGKKSEVDEIIKIVHILVEYLDVEMICSLRDIADSKGASLTSMTKFKIMDIIDAAA